MEIFYSPQFDREYRQLPVGVKEKARKKEKIFRKNPFNSQLKTHKLSGRLGELWAFSIDYRYRIVFEFAGGKMVIFHVIGDHSVYKKL